MSPTLPSWFKQRQAKAEPAGDNALRLTAPQMPEAFIAIRQAEDGRWLAALRGTGDGPDLAVTGPEFTNPLDAWEAAFELYRQRMIV